MPIVKDDNKDRPAPEPTDGRTLLAPPAVCPAVYESSVLLLDDDMRKTMSHFCVPWIVQYFLATMGYTASRDVAMRWDKETDHEAISRSIGVFKGQNGYDEELSRLAVIKFSNAVEQCSADKKRKHAELATTSITDFQAMLGRGDRAELRASYKALNKEDTLPEYEGSDHFMGVYTRTFARDQFPSGKSLNTSMIIAQHTLKGEVKHRKPKQTKDGEQYIDEEANPVFGKEQWFHQMQIFRQTLWMASSGAVHCPRLLITKKDLDKL